LKKLNNAAKKLESKGGVIVLPEGEFPIGGKKKNMDLGFIVGSNLLSKTVVIVGQGSSKTKLSFPDIFSLQNTGKKWGGKSALGFSGGKAFQKKKFMKKGSALTVDASMGATSLTVASVADFKVGETVAIGWKITPAFISDFHGQQGHWEHDKLAKNGGTWTRAFMRTVTAVDPATNTLTIDEYIQYEALVSNGAMVKPYKEKAFFFESGIAGLSVSLSHMAKNLRCANDIPQYSRKMNAIITGKNILQDNAIMMDSCINCFINDVKSFRAAGVTVDDIKLDDPTGDPENVHLHSGGLKVSDSRLVTVQNSFMGYPRCHVDAGNGYMIHIQMSNDVLVRDSEGRAGRHNLITNNKFFNVNTVFQRCRSIDGHYFPIGDWTDSALPRPADQTAGGPSDSHAALSGIALLWDNNTFNDGLDHKNRGSSSGYAGITATASVYYNSYGEYRDDDLPNFDAFKLVSEADQKAIGSGKGYLAPSMRSHQGKYGYVIGTGGVWSRLQVDREIVTNVWGAKKSWDAGPMLDVVDYAGNAAQLPDGASLYDAQVAWHKTNDQ